MGSIFNNETKEKFDDFLERLKLSNNEHKKYFNEYVKSIKINLNNALTNFKYTPKSITIPVSDTISVIHYFYKNGKVLSFYITLEDNSFKIRPAHIELASVIFTLSLNPNKLIELFKSEVVIKERIYEDLPDDFSFTSLYSEE